MRYIVSPLTDGAYVIAIEDNVSWPVMSYTNIYVLKRDSQTILIDAGAKEYQVALEAALAEIGVTPAMVTHILLTHGHHDHVEGAAMFKNARKYVHSADLSMIAPSLAAEFSPFTPHAKEFTFTAEGVTGLEMVLVNTHSLGSVAIYDHITKALFVGDFFCYFGEELPEGQLVTNSERIKRGSCQYVAGQAAAGGLEFVKFMQGLGRLQSYSPEFFCTGHGVVLRDNIGDFLQDMYQSGTK